MSDLGNKVIRVCRELALCTEEPGRTTRTFLSPPMHEVHRRLGAWMRQAGMRVSVDAAGNLRGVHPGSSGKRLAIISHLDTVPNSGAFDGILGVVLGLALVETLVEARTIGPTIEVIGFSEEEGVRFGIPFIGSRAVAGTLDETVLTPAVLDAIRAFGSDPAHLSGARLSPETTACIEFHIEQGPVLESLGLPLGIVDGIVGQSRLNLTFHGSANHAGTTPMSMRRDALAAAAEWIVEVEKMATHERGLVATVGSITAEPNATNVIPGVTRVSLDVRHACDETRHTSVAGMLAAAEQICARRQFRLDHQQRLDQPAVTLDAGLRETLSRSVEASGYPVHHMTSGAGHDAMILAAQVPTAMLFLRSPGGVSHHPDESVIAADVEAAIEAGLEFVRHV
jgi:allantoate deiminase